MLLMGTTQLQTYASSHNDKDPRTSKYVWRYIPTAIRQQLHSKYWARALGVQRPYGSKARLGTATTAHLHWDAR